MSWRQPARKAIQDAAHSTVKVRTKNRAREGLIIFHLADVLRLDAFEESRRFGHAEFGVGGLDAEEETVVRSVLLEAIDIEEWVMRLRQFVEREHAQHRGDRREKNRQFERDGDESGPTVQRAATDVHGISNGSYPVLEAKSAESADQSTRQGDQRHQGTLQPQRLRESFDGEGRVSLDVAIAGLADLGRRLNDLARRLKLTHDAVNV